MKARMFQRSLAVAAFAAIALAANAQQEHQTYSGPFGKNNAGTATCSYYTGDDGRRMFDGKYTYNRPSETHRFFLRYDHGHLIESYSEELATGDRSGQGKEDGPVGRPLMKEINKLLSQPYGYKEMPVRSSLFQEQQAINTAAINAEASKFGFLGYPGYNK